MTIVNHNSIYTELSDILIDNHRAPHYALLNYSNKSFELSSNEQFQRPLTVSTIITIIDYKSYWQHNYLCSKHNLLTASRSNPGHDMLCGGGAA